MNLPKKVRRLSGKTFLSLFMWSFGLFYCVHIAHAVPLKNIQFDRINIQNEPRKDIGIGPLNAIAQDATGYMWFGGELGLVRYDAHGFVFYRADKNDPHSLNSSFIRDLVLDRQGVLWIASSDGLSRYIYELDQFENFMHTTESNSLADNSVRALAVDSQDRLYIGTLKGLSVLDKTRKHYRNYGTAEGLSDSFIRALFIDKQDRVWIGTANGGLNLFDPVTERFTHWRSDAAEPTSLPSDSVEAITEDLDGVLWVGTFGAGIARMKPDQSGFDIYQQNSEDPNSIGNNVIRELYVDSDNNLWVGIDHKGLAVFDRDREAFIHHTYSAYDATSIGSNSIRSLFEDAKGDLWVGTFPAGVNLINRAKTVFQNLKHDPENPNTLSHSGVLCLLEARKGIVWMGTEGGLSSYSPATGEFKHFRADPNGLNNLRSNAVVTIVEDDNGDLWVGTWSGGLYRFDVSAETFEVFYPDKNVPGSINSPFIWKIVRDKNNTLWIGTEAGGVSRYDRSSKQFVSYTHSEDDPTSISFNYVWTLLNDRNDVLWVGTLNGLNRMNKKEGTFTRYFHDPKDDRTLSSNRIISLFEDSRGRLWVGTEEGGLNLYWPDQQRFSKLTVKDGLPSPNIASIIEDTRGYIWVSTSNGIASIAPDNFEIQVFTTNDGIAGNVHNRDASMMDDAGRVYFGSTEGVTLFDPARLSNQSVPPKLVINGLKVLNQPVAVGSDTAILKKVVSASHSITLRYSDTMFAFDYAALSFRAPELNQYAYKLEGFDSEWNYVGSMRTATYTNIDAGNYIFRVKGANSNGLWNEAGVSLGLHILPPPWQTWWAYLAYILVVCVFVIAVFNFKVKRIELEKERRVNAKLLKLDKLKDSFLANTSHELRTPLNGIVGITESLMDGVYGVVSDGVMEKLRTIAFSGRRLAALINDILDYAKLKEQKIQLHTQAVNLRETVELVFALLMPLAQSKQIQLINSVSDSQPRVEADSNRLQQILLNLIGNAIKYTHKDHGYVRVFAEQYQTNMKISIEDAGIGIPQEDLDLIFEAFNQGDGVASQIQEGTGLGLAVSKQLVENHGGTLSAISHVGTGSTFYFTLPMSQKAEVGGPVRMAKNLLSTEQLAVKYDRSGSPAPNYVVTRNEGDLSAIAKPSWSHQCTILVVDDDAVNRIVLQGILGLHNYQVIEAKDGFEALRILHQPMQKIDLVILDIMMPGLSGFDVCATIREEHSLQDLPVIFLTAKDIESDIQRGFQVGANEFVSKPVSKYQLLPRIENCLNHVRKFNELRDRLKDYLRDALEAAD